MTDLPIPPPPRPWSTPMSPFPDDYKPHLHNRLVGYPVANTAADERAAETFALNRQVAAILHRAAVEIAALGEFDWMARGYDYVDAMTLLADITPKPDDPKEQQRVVTSERDRG